MTRLAQLYAGKRHGLSVFGGCAAKPRLTREGRAMITGTCTARTIIFSDSRHVDKLYPGAGFWRMHAADWEVCEPVLQMDDEGPLPVVNHSG